MTDITCECGVLDQQLDVLRALASEWSTHPDYQPAWRPLIKQRLRLLDTAALAIHYGVAQGTIRYWASTDHWHPYGTRRARLWDMIEVQRSYDTRHPQEACA